MNEIINDFFQLGSLRILARILMGLRGLYIVTHLDPMTLGEYTVWLLFVFYATLLDGGVLIGLERDLPHYRGSGEAAVHQKAADIGFSTFFSMNGLAAVLLVAVSLVFLKGPLLSVYLGLYLLCDKIYRAFDTSARIHFRYRENGIAELISTALSFGLIVFLLPRFGAHYIFLGFIMGAAAATVYLSRVVPLNFRWTWHPRESVKYVLASITLLVMASSMEIFHATALTVLALRWDRQTLGFFVFAFRIFQILLIIFPVLIQEVVRTRMYFWLARAKEEMNGFRHMILPLGFYGLVTAVIWIAGYCWVDWVVWRFVKYYIPSVHAVKLLVIALLPLGITKIASDYLCSRVHNKAKFVIFGWLSGIIVQAVCLYCFPIAPENILVTAPLIYLGATLWVYFLIVSVSFAGDGRWAGGICQSVIMLLPMAVAIGAIVGASQLTGWHPTGKFQDNILPFIVSLLIFGAVITGMLAALRRWGWIQPLLVKES